ncbi:MAG: hypothetical protein KatS3mg051_1064 [Anaerolineae bacterium]|nr:MAG: hypothetical protein KatS3mg051_1064 [Anaerolineae bacterium]
MAIAGSGGWVPSRLVYMRNGRLLCLGYQHNVPREAVCDYSQAAELLRAGEAVRVEVANWTIPRLMQELECRHGEQREKSEKMER